MSGDEAAKRRLEEEGEEASSEEEESGDEEDDSEFDDPEGYVDDIPDEGQSVSAAFVGCYAVCSKGCE